MPVEQNKQLIGQFFEHMNTLNLDAVFSLITEGAVVWVAGDPDTLPGAGSKTRQAFKETL